MHMTFWWGDDLGDFFIKGLKVDSPGSMTLLCLSLFSLSVAVEGLKVSVEAILVEFQLQNFPTLFRYIERGRERKPLVRNRGRYLVRRVNTQR